MAVPMSPDQVFKKRMGSSNTNPKKMVWSSKAMIHGNFGQRAEDRNRGTAQIYNRLGLAEYEAMEAFVRWKF
jgi:glucosamine-6-phosphate deaminase